MVITTTPTYDILHVNTPELNVGGVDTDLLAYYHDTFSIHALVGRATACSNTKGLEEKSMEVVVI